jgi:hypothetical protein
LTVPTPAEGKKNVGNVREDKVLINVVSDQTSSEERAERRGGVQLIRV